MKIILVLAVFYSGAIFGQSSVYEQTLQTLNGKSISMGAFKGKKILIAAVTPASLQSGSLSFFDSLQKARPGMLVIIFPVLDFGGDSNPEILKTIKNKESLKTLVVSASQVTKASGSAQHPLMRWCTRDTENSHFNSEITADNHLFLISETGILYSSLEKGTAALVINDLLDQKLVVH
jgi:glutathione peroxidase-family protein